MSEDAGEKTLAPTAKRLRDAASNGDVLRSKDLGTAASVLVGAGFLKVAGGWLLRDLDQVMRAGLTWNRADLDNFAPGQMLLAYGMAALPPVLALGGAMVLVTLVSQLALSGDGHFIGGNLAPKASRINPMSGLARVFGPQGWIEAGKGILKVTLLGAIAWKWGSGRIAQFAMLPAQGLAGQLASGWQSLTSLFLALGVGLGVLALFDFPVQWWRRQRRLRMSQQEQRDEHKETDGNPENKQAIRARQRQLAMAGMASAMRKAQFVITNPTHFSVAMTYDPTLASAPVVLAKGRGEKALAIRELAAEHGLPVLEYPALARSVYYTTRERQMIREELYAAVASVLAFVLALKRGEDRATPTIDVPITLRFDADGRLETTAPANSSQNSTQAR
jgi:flagellar biosynthetic protein FlhB